MDNATMPQWTRRMSHVHGYHCQVLYADHNNVGTIGGKALGEFITDLKIATLYIDSNNFGDEGIAAIAKGQ